MHIDTLDISQIAQVERLANEMELSEIESKIEQMKQYDHSSFMGKPNAIGLYSGMMISHGDKVPDEKLDAWYSKLIEAYDWMRGVYQEIPVDNLIGNPFFEPLVEVSRHLQRMGIILDALSSNSRNAANQKELLLQLKEIANNDIPLSGRPYRDYIGVLEKELQKKVAGEQILEYVV